MATCPRCVINAPAYGRCDRCGLMLGFEGLTVLLDNDGSAAFRRASQVASRRPSFTRFREENGHSYARVTYSLSELSAFGELVTASQGLKGKRLFLNGMEIQFPRASEQLVVPRELMLRTRSSGASVSMRS